MAVHYCNGPLHVFHERDSHRLPRVHLCRVFFGGLPHYHIEFSRLAFRAVFELGTTSVSVVGLVSPFDFRLVLTFRQIL